MKVLIICHVYPPEHAPAGVMTSELAASLSERGHEVTIVTGWPNHPAGILFPGWRARWRAVERDRRGFTVVRCGHSIHPRAATAWRLWYYLSFALSTFIGAVLVGRVDALLCLSTPVFGGWTAWAVARLRRARFVYAIYDLHPESAANAGLIRRGIAYGILRAIDSMLCRWSDAIITLGAGLRREIVARGVEAERVYVVPLWLDGGKIAPAPRVNAWRAAHGIPPEQTVALYAGTIGYVSGAEMLIETAARLAPRDDILLLCVGDGPVKDRLIAVADANGLRNIRFLPFQPDAVLQDVQATADVGLVTLLPEAGRTSVPSKVLGYLAAGRPVLASVAEESDTAAMVRAGDCGIVTPPQDAAALADAIRAMADDPIRCRVVGERAREFFLREYDQRACIGAYERILAGSAPLATADGGHP